MRTPVTATLSQVFAGVQMRTIVLSLLGSVLITVPAVSQQIETARSGFAPESGTLPAVAGRSSSDDDASVGALLVKATFGALVGVVGGAYGGYKLEEPHCGGDDLFCGLAGGIIGATIGSTVLIPLAVHVENRNASLVSKLGMSALTLAGAAALAVPTSGISMLLMPPAQIAGTVWLEHRATRRKKDR